MTPASRPPAPVRARFDPVRSRGALVVVCGLMASGKSTVARGLSGWLGAELIEADRIRAELFRGGDRDAFVPGFSRRVYAEMIRRADAALDRRVPVVLDGSFRTRRRRARARALARRHLAPFRVVECRATPEICRRRLRERDLRRGRSGWTAMFEFFLRRWEPVREIDAAEHRIVDTSATPPDPGALARDLGIEPSPER